MKLATLLSLLAVAAGPTLVVVQATTNYHEHHLRRNLKKKGGGRNNNDDDNRSQHRMRNTSAVVVPTPPNLTDTQIADLLYVNEEERMARDVYAYYWNGYQARVFETIMYSQQYYMDMTKAATVTYGVGQSSENATLEAVVGNYTNQTLQIIYKEMTQNVTSLLQALRNAALMEETDILDLRDAISALNGTQPTLAKVYDKLLRASENHLRTFAGILEELDVDDYETQHDDMDQDDVDDILERGWKREREFEGIHV